MDSRIHRGSLAEILDYTISALDLIFFQRAKILIEFAKISGFDSIHSLFLENISKIYEWVRQKIFRKIFVKFSLKEFCVRRFHWNPHSKSSFEILTEIFTEIFTWKSLTTGGRRKFLNITEFCCIYFFNTKQLIYSTIQKTFIILTFTEKLVISFRNKTSSDLPPHRVVDSQQYCGAYSESPWDQLLRHRASRVLCSIKRSCNNPQWSRGYFHHFTVVGING